MLTNTCIRLSLKVCKVFRNYILPSIYIPWKSCNVTIMSTIISQFLIHDVKFNEPSFFFQISSRCYKYLYIYLYLCISRYRFMHQNELVFFTFNNMNMTLKNCSSWHTCCISDLLHRSLENFVRKHHCTERAQ